MRVRGAWAWTTLLAVSLSGCSLLHRHPSQRAQAPPLKTGQGAIEQQQKKEHQPPPPSSLPQPTVQTSPPELPPVEPPKVKRKKKVRQADSEPVPAQQTAAVAAPAAPASPIGQLTAGDSASEEQTKQATITLISGTEEGLGGIKRRLSKEEQTTVVQIRVFLKQAKQALQNGDMDGAHTLATKAKLLLDELTKD